MIKKAILAGTGAMLLAGLFFGRDAFSYISTSAGWVKNSVKNSVPMEFEIERARKMVKDLAPEIHKNMHVIAREEVEVDRLTKQIAQTEERLTSDKTNILKLKGDLESGQRELVYAGRNYSVQQVKVDLSNRFERYKTNDATLASLRQILDARENSLSAARQKLENMLAVKRQLEVDVENLEARLKMVEAAQTTSEYNFDDSRLSRAKELIGDLRTRLDVAAKMVDAEGNFHAEIPVSESASSNIVDQVTEYFSGETPHVASR